MVYSVTEGDEDMAYYNTGERPRVDGALYVGLKQDGKRLCRPCGKGKVYGKSEI